MPSSRWSTVAAVSSSSRSPSCSTVTSSCSRVLPPAASSAPSTWAAVAVVGHAGGPEAHHRVVLDVEESGRPQVRVAPLVPGVEAVGVDDHDHVPCLVVIDLEPPLDALEVALDRGEPPEAGDGELGARAGRVEPPACADDLVGVVCDAHAVSTNGRRTWGHLGADFGEAPPQEAALGLRVRELERAGVLIARLVPPADAAEQIRPGWSGSTGSCRDRAGRRARARLRRRPARPRRSPG